jgi:hypothetical protein
MALRHYIRLMPAAPSHLRIDLTERVLIVLRDGRNLLGVLRSYDQYGTLCIHQHIGHPFRTVSKNHRRFSNHSQLGPRVDDRENPSHKQTHIHGRLRRIILD